MPYCDQRIPTSAPETSSPEPGLPRQKKRWRLVSAHCFCRQLLSSVTNILQKQIRRDFGPQPLRSSLVIYSGGYSLELSADGSNIQKKRGLLRIVPSGFSPCNDIDETGHVDNFGRQPQA